MTPNNIGESSPPNSVPDPDDELNLGDLLVRLWHGRWLIVFCVVVGAALALASSYVVAKYESEGFFQFGGPIPVVEKDRQGSAATERRRDNNGRLETEPLADPGVSLADFKRFAAAYSTPERFNEYVVEKKLGSEPGVAGLRSQFMSRSGIANVVQPVYPFTKLDAKVLMEQPRGSSNNVLGLQIRYAADSAEEAQRMTRLLGSYVIDSILYLVYSDAVLFKSEEIAARLTAVDSTIIEQRMRLEQHRRAAEHLAQLIARHPAAAEQSIRQVVEITEETARFLPPATLLTTARVQEAEANEAIVQAGLERRREELLLEYYRRVNAVLAGTKSGETVLRSLEAIKQEVFKDKDMTDQVVQAVFNRITVENQNAINVYLNKSRFIAGPTLPSHSTARPALALAVGLTLGLLLSILLIFAASWWTNNRERLS